MQKTTHDFVLSQKRIYALYEINNIIQETYVYCAHLSFKELVA